MSTNRRTFIQQTSALAMGLFVAPSLEAVARPLLLDESSVALRRPTMYAGGDVAVESGRLAVWPDAQTSRYLVGGVGLFAFEFTTGDVARIPIVNRTTSPVTIHWHGLDVPADMDGHPKDAFSAGVTKEYTFPIKNRAGLYFFHSHSHMATAREVYLGLAGMMIVRDDEERALNLPNGEFEIPMLIQDVRVDAQGQIAYTPTMNDMMNGWMGNRVLVNGTPNTYCNVKRGMYRLRLVNGSNARTYKLQFSNSQAFTLIGVDGGLLEQPQTVTSVMFSPAERLDILVDFSSIAAGNDVRLVSAPYTAPVEMMAPIYPQGIALDILRFSVTTDFGVQYQIPPRLSTFPETPNVSSLSSRQISLAMSRGMGMGMRPTLNGQSYDINRVDFQVAADSYEIWEFRNTENAMVHPMHIHGRQFRILSRSGGTLAPTDLGLKDTVLVGAQETVRVLVHHSEYEGMFLFHCHNLEHEDEGMMQNYVVRRTTGVQDVETASIEVFPNPARSYVAVHTEADRIESLVLTDSRGHVVLRQRDVASGTLIPIDELPPGTYHLTDGLQHVPVQIVR